MFKKMLLPILGFIGALCVALLITFPMLSMTPKDVFVGVISLDEGVSTPSLKVNAGDKVIDGLLKSDNDLIVFKEAKSYSGLKKDLEDGRYYAYMVIPSDFTRSNGSSKIKVVINEGLNPMVTMSLSNVFNVMGKKSGMNFDISSIHSVSSLGIKAMLLPMMFILLTFITSVITGYLISNGVKDFGKVKSYLLQLIYIAVMGVVIGFVVSSLVLGISGVEKNVLEMGLFLTVVSLSFMLLVSGSVNLFGKKGLGVLFLLFVLGMGLVQIPYEYINGVWQVLVASWEPFRYIGIGVREVLYQGHGIINNSFISLLVMAIIGVLFSIIGIFKKA